MVHRPVIYARTNDEKNEIRSRLLDFQLVKKSFEKNIFDSSGFSIERTL